MGPKVHPCYTRALPNTTVGSAHRRMDKMWHICKMEYYSALKRKEMPKYVTVWMNPEDAMLSEISQLKRDKCRMVSCDWQPGPWLSSGIKPC